MKIFKIVVITSIALVVGLLIKGKFSEYRVNTAYTSLKAGMSKADLDKNFGGVQFIKEQKIMLYPSRNEAQMKGDFRSRMYDDVSSRDMFESIVFDGTFSSYIYLARKYYNFPNGWFFDYIFVVFDNKNNKVIGWGKDGTMGVIPDLF